MTNQDITDALDAFLNGNPTAEHRNVLTEARDKFAALARKRADAIDAMDPDERLAHLDAQIAANYGSTKL